MKTLFKILFPSLLVICVGYITAQYCNIYWPTIIIGCILFFLIQICMYKKNPRGMNKIWFGLSVWGSFATISTSLIDNSYLNEILSLISASMFFLYLFFVIIPEYYSKR